MVCALSCAPSAYNSLAVLILNIFDCVFWLISMALLAEKAASAFNSHHVNYFGVVIGDDFYNAPVITAAAALSGIEL